MLFPDRLRSSFLETLGHLDPRIPALYDHESIPRGVFQDEYKRIICNMHE